MMHFSRLSPERLAQIDPAGVKVKVSAPKGWVINIASAKLVLTVSGASGSSRTADMHLRLLRSKNGKRGGGLFSSPVPVTTYWLALSKPGVRQLRTIQQFIQMDQARKFNFDVNWKFSSCPPGANQVELWAGLQLAPDKEFMTLIDGAKLDLPEGQACGDGEKNSDTANNPSKRAAKPLRSFGTA
jgi:hypothetical protein